jgi:hypothetical protein
MKKSIASYAHRVIFIKDEKWKDTGHEVSWLYACRNKHMRMNLLRTVLTTLGIIIGIASIICVISIGDGGKVRNRGRTEEDRNQQVLDL